MKPKNLGALGASARLTGRAALAALLISAVHRAHAQVQITTGTGTVGEGAWSAVKNLWFGPPGLVLGAVVFALAVYFFFKDGVLSVLGVIAIGTFFFFVPAMVVAVQGWARGF